VRGEYLGEPWWTYTGTKLETADTAKESLQFTGPPLLGSRSEKLGRGGTEDESVKLLNVTQRV